MIDVEADDLSFGVEIDIEPGRHFAGFRPRLGLQFDIEAVGFRIIVKLHRSSLRKLQSKKALWIDSPSARVTTRNIARGGGFRPCDKAIARCPCGDGRSGEKA